MYTLRLFEETNEIGRIQFYLGESYTVKKVSNKEESQGITCRIFGNGKIVPNDGIAIYKHQYAFIMSPNGQTFETLNKPLAYYGVEKPKIENANIVIEHVNDICVESLSPEQYENWEKVLHELKINRSDLEKEPLKG